MRRIFGPSSALPSVICALLFCLACAATPEWEATNDIAKLAHTEGRLDDAQAAFEQALEIAETRENLYATAGIHPHHASDWNDDSYAALWQLAQHDCVRAIGETGLDFNRNYSLFNRLKKKHV